MQSGWIKFYRKTFHSDIWKQSPLTLKAFLWLMGSANHKPGKVFLGVSRGEATINRGEIVTSYRSWAQALAYRDGKRGSPWQVPTIRNMRTILNRLEIVQMVTRLPTRGCLHLRVENYGLYQARNEIPTDVLADEATDKRQTADTKQEGKKYKNGLKEEKNKTYMADFDIFWDAYGYKVGKKKSLVAWRKVEVPIVALLEAIDNQRKPGGPLSLGKKEYWLHPATWLNGQRWEDEQASEAELPDWMKGGPR